MGTEMPTRYEAGPIEQKWYRRWEAAGLFKPSDDSSKPTWSVTIPPPNVTGSLHMGHALCYTVQDLLGRYRRMRGDNVLILPGLDHAGIATQSVVAKLVKEEGTTPIKMGREKFLERVWAWREESGGTILSQFKALGCAFDWDRERFTLDEAYQEAVLKVFVEWFDRGLVYKGVRVVNWDPVLKTSISDIETERRVTKGKLYKVRYRFADGTGHVTVATTRPETILADVAVAVHPSDQRYQALHGQTLLLPLVDREIPLIVDEHPDPEFGTGAVKITPAHDANDFEVGKRHGLPMPCVFDDSAKMTADCGEYAGLDRFEARKRIVADLESAGLLEAVEDHEIALVVSERSHEVTEPMASEQWFVDQEALAKAARDAVTEGKIAFWPERYETVFMDWMNNLRDWCVSRQLWWGHRIPVYTTESGKTVAAVSWAEAEAKSGEKITRQEDDVLDTWFSSGLWPFATLGWPQAKADIIKFYPTSVLVTAKDILFLWVARMIMMGLDFIGDIPFHNVYIHATVLNEQGKRMSKSLGTGVDPMDVIQDKGADALRYTLLAQTGSNQDIRYSEKKTVEARNFCNKIWNASRFVLMNLQGEAPTRPNELRLVDKWILSRLAAAEQEVREGYESYDIQRATQALYQFFWNELCDWYIETSKQTLTEQRTLWVLDNCLTAFLIMMHPVMPHITEEIFSQLPSKSERGMLMQAAWPSWVLEFSDRSAEQQVESWFQCVRAVRALRADLDLTPGTSVAEAYAETAVGPAEEIICSQAWIEQLHTGRPHGKSVTIAVEGNVFHLLVDSIHDVDKLLVKWQRSLQKSEEEISKLKVRLADPDFVSRAKPELVQQDRERIEALAETVARTKENLALLQG